MRVFDFDSAFVRQPASTVTNGLRVGSHSGPSFEALAAEHRAYVSALELAGLEVELLPPLPAYPDSIFVEDPAFVLPEGAILLRPGAASREGESAELAGPLRRRFERLSTLHAGYADGGDILILPGEILVGMSARTDRRGAEAFAAWAAGLGRVVRIVETPPGVLHLKTACSLVDEETVLATPALASAGLFGSMRVLFTPAGEEAAANALRINDALLVSASYPRTAEKLSAQGLNVVPLETSEIQKLDAGLSCMSLRWGSL
jgi:dimethylargininase